MDSLSTITVEVFLELPLNRGVHCLGRERCMIWFMLTYYTVWMMNLGYSYVRGSVYLTPGSDPIQFWQ